ncbi:hypothetical protein GD627_15435 [Arthrobacter yangruifuii]|uniref:Uncharacterized protein n=1 Tax=Arthrobacter yangruifuii TaxID=2606616 RepID=A0A5N6ME72_9MICC|nr:hypothetical protein [Arthrobacter yangruifuii]KAD3456082.1 hypothetical protein GD627_15435 [Arthrobacter yangruifuii]
MWQESRHAETMRADGGHFLDGVATRWLLVATGVGGLVAWFLADPGRLTFLPENWVGSQLVSFGAGIVAALLLLAAWFFTARTEKQVGIRQQRGAMAALAGLAVFCIPFLPGLVFSPVFGAALILLAVRTRDVRTAAMGITALACALALAFVPVFPGAMLIPVLVAVGALAVAVQLGSGPAKRHHPM